MNRVNYKKLQLIKKWTFQKREQWNKDLQFIVVQLPANRRGFFFRTLDEEAAALLDSGLKSQPGPLGHLVTISPKDGHLEVQCLLLPQYPDLLYLPLVLEIQQTQTSLCWSETNVHLFIRLNWLKSLSWLPGRPCPPRCPGSPGGAGSPGDPSAPSSPGGPGPPGDIVISADTRQAAKQIKMIPARRKTEPSLKTRCSRRHEDWWESISRKQDVLTMENLTELLPGDVLHFIIIHHNLFKKAIHQSINGKIKLIQTDDWKSVDSEEQLGGGSLSSFLNPVRCSFVPCPFQVAHIISRWSWKSRWAWDPYCSRASSLSPASMKWEPEPPGGPGPPLSPGEPGSPGSPWSTRPGRISVVNWWSLLERRQNVF